MGEIIKTVTNKKVVGVKLIWTVDAQKALEFIDSYSPSTKKVEVDWKRDYSIECNSYDRWVERWEDE